MSKVIAYKNTDRLCFCQIKFRSKERILVSIATVPEPGIKVIKLLVGIIPYKTLWEYNAATARGKDPQTKLLAMFADQTATEAKHPLDAIISKLLPCRSCREAVSVLHQTEQAYRSS